MYSFTLVVLLVWKFALSKEDFLSYFLTRSNLWESPRQSRGFTSINYLWSQRLAHGGAFRRGPSRASWRAEAGSRWRGDVTLFWRRAIHRLSKRDPGLHAWWSRALRHHSECDRAEWRAEAPSASARFFNTLFVARSNGWSTTPSSSCSMSGKNRYALSHAHCNKSDSPSRVTCTSTNDGRSRITSTVKRLSSRSCRSASQVVRSALRSLVAATYPL